MTNVRIDGLEFYILQCLHKAVDEAAEDAVSYLTLYIMRHWYHKYDPKIYKRTFDFINSASKTDAHIIGNNVSCLIYFDTEKIKPRFYGPWKLNPHTSFSGKDVSENIPAWIELGNPNMKGERRKALGSMEATAKMLEREFHNMVAKRLRKQGLKIKVDNKKS